MEHKRILYYHWFGRFGDIQGHFFQKEFNELQNKVEKLTQEKSDREKAELESGSIPKISFRIEMEPVLS